MKNIEEIISNMRVIISETHELETLRAIAFALVNTLNDFQEMTSIKL